MKLLDVFPDGRVMNMQEGITRARYRDGFDKARMMEPGKVYEVLVDLHATSWFLPAGTGCASKSRAPTFRASTAT